LGLSSRMTGTLGASQKDEIINMARSLPRSASSLNVLTLWC
jgi:hypothetical protein